VLKLKPLLTIVKCYQNNQIFQNFQFFPNCQMFQNCHIFKIFNFSKFSNFSKVSNFSKLPIFSIINLFENYLVFSQSYIFHIFSKSIIQWNHFKYQILNDLISYEDIGRLCAIHELAHFDFRNKVKLFKICRH